MTGALQTLLFAIFGIIAINASAAGWFLRSLDPVSRLACLVFGVLCYFPQIQAKAAGAIGILILAGLFKRLAMKTEPDTVKSPNS